MKILLRAAAVVLAAALSTPAIARPHHPPPPVTTIHFHGGSVGFIVGVGGASGFVRFHGVKYPIDVSGLKVGTIGITSYDVDGRVFNLHRLEDIEGVYASGEASATAVIRAHPSLPTAWFYYGQYLENSKRYREAAACFEKITMHQPPWHNWTVAAARKELGSLR